jgi:hypothetical protein
MVFSPWGFFWRPALALGALLAHGFSRFSSRVHPSHGQSSPLPAASAWLGTTLNDAILPPLHGIGISPTSFGTL